MPHSTQRVFLLLLSLFASGPAAQAAPGYWVSFASETTQYEGIERAGTIQVTVSRKNTKGEAEAEALASCRAKSKNPQNCKTLDLFNSGCLYVSVGVHPIYGNTAHRQSTVGPQSAYKACHDAGYNCWKTVYGACADPAEDNNLPIKEFPRHETWGALAAGRGSNSTHHYAWPGGGTGTSRAEAEQEAMNVCNQVSKLGPGYCKIVNSYKNSCGFISIAKDNPYGGELGWGAGNTAQTAYNACTGAGYRCDTETYKICAHTFHF